MASTKPDRELSEAAFHSKYGFIAGWEDAREMVWSAMKGEHNEQVRAAMRGLWESMNAAVRESKQADYVARIDP